MTRRSVQGGVAIPVHVIGDSDLEQNGGTYKLKSKVATLVNYDVSAQRGSERQSAVAVYPVSDAQIESGEYSLGGGAATSIDIVHPGYNDGHFVKTDGSVAIPVYPVAGSAPIVPSEPAPDDLPNLIIWHEDDQLLYQLSSGDTPAEIGDPVGYWGNLAGGDPLTADGDARPIRTANGIRFNYPFPTESGDEMRSTQTISPGRPITAFLVAKTESDGGVVEARRAVIGETDGGWYMSITGNNGGAWAASQNSVSASGGVQTDTLCIFTTVFSGAGSLLQLDNNSEVVGDTGVNSDFAGWGIAHYGEFVAWKQCDVRAVLIYRGALDAEQMALVRNYLNEKFAIY